MHSMVFSNNNLLYQLFRNHRLEYIEIETLIFLLLEDILF